MSQEELFDFLKTHLKIELEDDPTPTWFGGECPGNAGFTARLMLLNPLTKEWELVNEVRIDLT